MEKIKIHLIADIVLKDGQKRLAFKNPDYYRDQISRLDDRKKVIVTIENQSSSRSGQQNKYWHGVCFPIIAELTGYTEQEAKELCKKQFIKPKVVEIKGKEYEIPRGTSELTKWEGVQFTQDLMSLAHELGGNIPSPQDAGYEVEGFMDTMEVSTEIEYPDEYKEPTI